MPDMGPMIYDTKTALILRRDLAAWQVANVAAFLAGGLMGTHGHMMGEPYRDGNGRAYTALIREPVFVYGATLEELRRTHQRALSRELVPAIYIEPMFKTTKRRRQPRRAGRRSRRRAGFRRHRRARPAQDGRQGGEQLEVPKRGPGADASGSSLTRRG